MLFNEVESLAEPLTDAVDADAVEEAVSPSAKRKPLPAELPRVEVIHELPEHELACKCGCRKYVSDEEVSEQLEIVPM